MARSTTGRAVSALLLAGGLCGPGPATVRAHDIYTNLYSGGAPGIGQWCCSGDAATGDCEAVGSGYRIEPNGDAVITSRRYRREVRVGREKITWLPVAGGEASEAHWCGKPRAAMSLEGRKPDSEQPDPDTWTYCAFITPGGV
jgi:hypothetical protein